MFAIVEIAGQQFKVEKDQTLYVHRLQQAEGASIELNNVLLVSNNGNVKIGAPSVAGANVKAKVLTHVKGDKVIVLRKNAEKASERKTVTVNHSPKFKSKRLTLNFLI